MARELNRNRIQRRKKNLKKKIFIREYEHGNYMKMFSYNYRARSTNSLKNITK